MCRFKSLHEQHQCDGSRESEREGKKEGGEIGKEESDVG